MAKYLANAELLFYVPDCYNTEASLCFIERLMDKFLDANLLDCNSESRLIGFTKPCLKKLNENYPCFPEGQS